MSSCLDPLGKNILRDFFVRLGTAETDVDVPSSDTQRIDVWHVPDPALLAAHPEMQAGLLRAMASEPGIVELWSAPPDVGDFHACMRKRYQWFHTLERREQGWVPMPTVWFVSAERPDAMLRKVGFVPDRAGPEGRYTSSVPGLGVHLAVLAELPRVRSTLLLRLLGSGEVRRMALWDLGMESKGAWEREVAKPWLSAEEREVSMDTQGWWAQKMREAEERGRLKGQLKWLAGFCAMRLGRPLTDAENASLAARFDRLGPDRVEQVVLSFSADALAAWLADPDAK